MSQTGDIFGTSLFQDILSVTETVDRSRVLHLSAIIHTEKEDFMSMKVLILENKRDYQKETGESFHLRVLMATGDYVWRVLPFRDHLEISLTTVYMLESGRDDEEQPPLQIRYKAILNTLTNAYAGAESIANKDNKELNHIPPIEVVFELVDRREELFRLKSVSGSYRNHTPEQLIRGVVFHEANKVKVDGKGILSAVDLEDPDQKDPIAEAFLPSTLLLRDLPGYIQERLNGVYTAGIGSFFQWYKNLPTFFVYPLYREDRFEKTNKEKLIIYSVPEEKLPSHDHTYRIEGKVIYIITTGQKKVVDHSNNPQLNTGTGFRLPDKEAFMTKPVEILESGIKAVRKRLNTELISRDRKDGVNYAPSSKGSNAFMELSRYQAQNFQGLTLTWENSDPSLLYPGMPMKFISMEKGQYTEKRGTLLKVFNVTSLQGNPTADTAHRCTSQLYFLTEPQDYIPENDPDAMVEDYER